MKIRHTDVEKDLEEIHQIWQEIGWMDNSTEDKNGLKIFLNGGKGIGAEINGRLEAFVNSVEGKVRYQNKDIPIHGLAGVTVSRIARKQGLASKLTAMALKEAYQNGMAISGLGMFDQGFYDKLGYGTGSYENYFIFDPDKLNVNYNAKIPERLTYKDWKKAHKSRLKRKKHHGYCTLHSENITKGEMYWGKKNSFGLGYSNNEGELTHYFWAKAEKAIHGPYHIKWLVYNNKEQFLELMALIKNLGDQVNSLSMWEPAKIHLQDLIKQPFKGKRITKNSDHQQTLRTSAYWQMRILNLRKCINATHLQNENNLQFNLKLNDPISKYLPTNSGWKGLNGNYILSLGKNSEVKKGKDNSLPTLKASIGAFTRLWLGVLPASGLTYTDNLSGPETLLNKLDQIFQIPIPKNDWDF